MAKQVFERIICDQHPLDKPQEDAVEVIYWNYDGEWLKKDVCTDCGDEYHADMKRYAKGAKRLGKAAPPPEVEDESDVMVVTTELATRKPVPRLGVPWWETPTHVKGVAQQQPYKDARGELREYGKKNGYNLGERGRIPQELGDEYTSALLAGELDSALTAEPEAEPDPEAEDEQPKFELIEMPVRTPKRSASSRKGR